MSFSYFKSDRMWTMKREYTIVVICGKRIVCDGNWIVRNEVGEPIHVFYSISFMDKFPVDLPPGGKFFCTTFELPKDAKPWGGDNEAPEDWDGEHVVLRNGCIRATSHLKGIPFNWNVPQYPNGNQSVELQSDIVGYFVKPKPLDTDILNADRSVGFYWVLIEFLDVIKDDPVNQWMNELQPAHWDGEGWTVLGSDEEEVVVGVGDRIAVPRSHMDFTEQYSDTGILDSQVS
jgi:hypothetical protein